MSEITLKEATEASYKLGKLKVIAEILLKSTGNEFVLEEIDECEKFIFEFILKSINKGE